MLDVNVSQVRLSYKGEQVRMKENIRKGVIKPGYRNRGALKDLVGRKGRKQARLEDDESPVLSFAVCSTVGCQCENSAVCRTQLWSAKYLKRPIVKSFHAPRQVIVENGRNNKPRAVELAWSKRHPKCGGCIKLRQEHAKKGRCPAGAACACRTFEAEATGQVRMTLGCL
jgi:hypothetical protein